MQLKPEERMLPVLNYTHSDGSDIYQQNSAKVLKPTDGENYMLVMKCVINLHNFCKSLAANFTASSR